MSHLINTNKPYAYRGKLQKENAKYTEFANSNYQIPAVWFMFFNDTDLVKTQFDYMTSEGETGTSEALMPCTTIWKAIANIESSFDYFNSLFNCPEYTHSYLIKTIEFFTEIEHEYLILDATDDLIMNIEKDQWSTFERCFSRTEEAKKNILNICGYIESIKPYSIEEFYSNPYLDDQDRLNNSRALNPNFYNNERRIKFPFE